MIKNILFVNTLNRNNISGGQEKYISQVSEILKTTDIKCFIAAPSSINKSCEQTIINVSKTALFKTLKQISKLIKENNINIIISNDCYSNLIIFIIKLFNAKIKTAAIIHDVYISKYMPLKLLVKKKLYYLFDRFILFFFDYQIYYSPYLYKKHYSKKATFWGGGLSINNDIVPVRTEHKKKKTIGFIARPDIVKKGIDIFAEIAGAPELKNNYFFIIAGIESNSAAAKILLQKNKSIMFFNYLQEPAEFYIAADYVIIPSRYEGLGLTLIEAIYYRKPIVCSDIPAFSQILKSIDYPIQPVKINDIHAYIKSIQNFSLSDEELTKYSERIKQNYSSDILEKNCLNFINNIVL